MGPVSFYLEGIPCQNYCENNQRVSGQDPQDPVDHKPKEQRALVCDERKVERRQIKLAPPRWRDLESLRDPEEGALAQGSSAGAQGPAGDGGMEGWRDDERGSHSLPVSRFSFVRPPSHAGTSSPSRANALTCTPTPPARARACDVKPDLLVSQADQQDPQLPPRPRLLPLALLLSGLDDITQDAGRSRNESQIISAARVMMLTWPPPPFILKAPQQGCLSDVL